MIEAPEALYLCEQLNKTVKGKRITNVFTLFTPHKFAWFSGSPDEYAEWLTGKSIDHARSQGGMVEMTIGDKMLILTDGVNLRYYAPGAHVWRNHVLQQGRRQRRTFRILPDSEKQAAGHVGRFQQRIFPRTD